MHEALKQRLQQQMDAGLWREHQVRHGSQSKNLQFGKQVCLNFNSNDYLGLSNHPLVKQAFVAAVEKYGVGSGSANTLSGYTQAHEDLCNTLAMWLKRDKALLFSSGYIANIAILTTLVQKQDIIFADKLNHASLNDGMRFSGAKFKRFSHNNLQRLQKDLEKYPTYNKWIVSEGIFSMEGDSADLLTLRDLAKQYQATLIIDDVHGLGVLGKTGAGSLEVHGLTQEDVPILMGGFGKAFGTQGAFVAGPKLFIDTLMQFARPYLFTTAMAPAIAAATRQSIAIVQEDKARREHLQHIIRYFRAKANKLGLHLLNSDTAIQPIILQSIPQTKKIAKILYNNDISVSMVRFPTVPMDSPRLRISLTSNHSEQDIDILIATLEKALYEETTCIAANSC